MNKHDNIYNILNKLSALEPPAKQESILKNLSESQTPAQKHLSEVLAEKYEGWKNTLQAVKESDERTMSRAAKGNEKYGKDGMKALAKAGREGASEKELDKIRDKHNKYDESVEVDEDMLAKKDYDGDGKKESPKDEYMGSRDKAIKKAMGKSKEEGNEFSGELDKARDAGKDSFKVGGKTYPVKEGEAVDQEGPADLLAAIEQEINNPGRSIDNLRDVLNATFGSDRSPEFRKARAVIGKYIDLVDNAAMGSEEDGIAPMRGGNIARHIQQYDLTDYLQHAAAMLDRAVNGSVKEGEYQDTVNKSKIPAYQRKAKGGDDWKLTQQDLDDEASKSPTGSAGLAKAKARLGMNEELQADDGQYYNNADDFFSTIEGDWLDREEESEDGMEVRGYIDDVNVMVFRYDDESKTSGYGLYDDEGLNDLDEGGEKQYDENDAHSSLPGVRKTTEEEHSRYDAAAHEIRKWMRKRGWNTNKEFKSALKYIMDNLDDKHDDSLTHRVKEAAKICEKHHATMVEAGLDMNLLSKAQGSMRGTNTDPESERNRGKKYGYRSDRDDTGNDDDYDEHGNEKKGVKKAAPSDGPKKKGRPKKNFGPERVTAKAYKHKGERKTNEGRAIDLEHYVEDTIAELEAMFIVEKAKSKSQQRFFGMVHAAQKGEKPASKEVAKVAKDIGKKDAKDFAKTKHKGLPDKVSEGINYAEMMRETNQTVEEMLNELHGEMDEYKRTGYLGDKLRDALDIHRHSKKLMDNQIPTIEEVPPESISAASTPPASISPQQITPVKSNSLSELAKLAGIEPIQEEPNEGNEFSGARADAIRAGKDTFSVGGKTFQVTDAEDEKINEGGCNMTAEGQYCEVHGMEECGMMEGVMDTMKGFAKSAGEKIMRHADITGYTKSKQNFTKWIDSHPALASHKQDLLLKFDAEANEDPHTPWVWGKQAIARWKEQQQGAIAEGKGKPDFLDMDKDGNKKEPMKKAVKDKEKTSESADYEKQIPQGMDDKYVKFKCPSCGTATNASLMRGNNYVCPSCEKPLPAKNQMPLGECGDMGPMGGMDQQDGISVNTSMDTKTGRKTVTVTADGDAAEELAQILKMAGMVGGSPKSEPKVISLGSELEEYANDPDPSYASTDAILRAGNDLNKPKKQDPGTANRAANPLGETAVQEDKLFKLYKSLKDIV